MRNVVAVRKLLGCDTFFLRHPFRALAIMPLCREIGVNFHNEEKRQIYDVTARHFTPRSIMGGRFAGAEFRLQCVLLAAGMRAGINEQRRGKSAIDSY